MYIYRYTNTHTYSYTQKKEGKKEAKKEKKRKEKRKKKNGAWHIKTLSKYKLVLSFPDSWGTGTEGFVECSYPKCSHIPSMTLLALFKSSRIS